MDRATQDAIERQTNPGFARLGSAVSFARQALMTNQAGRVCILDGTQFSPSWRALPEAEAVYQADATGAASEVLDELFNEFSMDHSTPNGETVAWEDGCLWVYGPEYDHGDVDGPARDLAEFDAELAAMREKRGRLERFEDRQLATPEGVTYVPFVDGPRVGYEIRRDGRAPMYLYFNPSSETDDGQPNVFVYMGEDNDPGADDVPLHFYDIPHGLHGTVSPDGERTEERLS